MTKTRWIFATLLVVSLFLISGAYSRAAINNGIQVSFIDVGQGDSALVRDSSGFDMLIDGGDKSAGPTVVAYIREQAVDDIDVMVASHGDKDHIGGLIDVLEAADIQVEQVIYSGYPHDKTVWTNCFVACSGGGGGGGTCGTGQYPQCGQD